MRDFPHTQLDNKINACFLLNKQGDLYFLFHNFNERKKVAEIYDYFLANEINSTEGDVMGPMAHVQIMFPVKDKRMQSIWRHFFWDVDEYTINGSQSLCDRTHCIEKASLFVATENTNSHLNNHICQYCGMKTSTVTPSFYYIFIISLSYSNSIPSFIGNLWQVLLLGNHLNQQYTVSGISAACWGLWRGERGCPLHRRILTRDVLLSAKLSTGC